MTNFNKNVASGNYNTGGRGTDEIRSCVNALMNRYSLHTGSFTPPIEPSILAKLQNATIIYCHGSANWVASLMPMGNGFVININKSLPESRKRNAICHETAHTFFFDTESRPPKRLKNPRPDGEEEHLCFWAAREMLAPITLFKSELKKIKCEKIYSFEGLSKLAEIFLVSPDIIAYRLTHDFALLGNDWIILWYSTAGIGEKVYPKSLYPKHISASISSYMKMKIVENIRNTVWECREKKKFVEKELKVGEKKSITFKIRTERVDGSRLCAISWVSPLSEL